MPISKRIKLRREVAERLLLLRELKFTNNASDMARSVGLTPQRWYNYETGRRGLDLDTACVVIEEHGVDFNWLYAGSTRGLSRGLARALAEQQAKVRPPKTKRKKRAKRVHVPVDPSTPNGTA
jgi:hypothetical protein